MVTMTVYVNSDVFCWIVNTLNNSFVMEWGDIKEVSLKRNRKYPYEVQVPIVIVGQFVKKDKTTINLYKLQNLNLEN